MKKIILLLVSVMLVSCNPATHIVGVGMRKLNTSQNKYSKQNPYIRR